MYVVRSYRFEFHEKKSITGTYYGCIAALAYSEAFTILQVLVRIQRRLAQLIYIDRLGVLRI